MATDNVLIPFMTNSIALTTAKPETQQGPGRRVRADSTDQRASIYTRLPKRSRSHRVDQREHGTLQRKKAEQTRDSFKCQRRS